MADMFPRGQLLAEGKTKKIFEVVGNTALVIIENKCGITAGDGLRRLELPTKDVLSTQMVANVYQLLQRLVPNHFCEVVAPNAFLAFNCTMLPIEVVIRRYADGSYLKRHPDVVRNTRLDDLVVEFYYKDDANHDPMIGFKGGKWLLIDPKSPEGKVVGKISPLCSPVDMEFIVVSAKRMFLALEILAKYFDHQLNDLKVEYGHNYEGMLMLADVITPDEWRLLDPEGEHLDKQPFRDGSHTTEEIQANYTAAVKLTRKMFELGKFVFGG